MSLDLPQRGSSALPHTLAPLDESSRPGIGPAPRAQPGAVHPGSLAVTIHDVEPRWMARVREIRRWLAERGVTAVTLLVIPAPDLHPISGRCPSLIAWLRGRCAAGDAIAQHGLAHRSVLRPPWPRSLLADWQGGRAAEFPGLDAGSTRQRVEMGRRLLREIELDPIGFVAPGYAYTRPLRRVLSAEYGWFADLGGIQAGPRRLRSPALCLGTSSPLKSHLSPAIARRRADGVLRREDQIVRVDIHPADFDHPGHVVVLETILERAAGRPTVTYDQLLD